MNVSVARLASGAMGSLVVDGISLETSYIYSLDASQINKFSWQQRVPFLSIWVEYFRWARRRGAFILNVIGVP